MYEGGLTMSCIVGKYNAIVVPHSVRNTDGAVTEIWDGKNQKADIICWYWREGESVEVFTLQTNATTPC